MDDGAAPLARGVEHAHCPQAVGHLLGEPALDPRRLRKLGGVEELGQRQREQPRGVGGRGDPEQAHRKDDGEYEFMAWAHS